MGGATANGIQAQAPPAPAERQQSQRHSAAPAELEGEAGLAAENECLRSELSQVRKAAVIWFRAGSELALRR